MRTFIALLMMTSVAAACFANGPDCLPIPAGKSFVLPPTVEWEKPIPKGCVLSTDGGFLCKNVNGECSWLSLETGCSDGSQPYTLVLRDKRGVMMLIRGLYTFCPDDVACVSGQGQTLESMSVPCKSIALMLKASPDIESAECFK